MKKGSILKAIIIVIIIVCVFLISLLIKEIKNKNKYINYYESNNVEIKEKYECNEFEFITVTVEDIITMYFNKYKYALLTDLEQAYNILNKEFREKKFGDFEEYKKYITNNIDGISKSRIEKFQIRKDENSTRYICIDQNGNYYIFNETAVMEFDIILDTYTLDLPDFIQKYNNATEQEKVALNIEKFIQAINCKDYKYAYNCLADSYKNNYFKTQQEFENYAKQNFYGNYTVEYKEFNPEGDVYTYSVILTDKETGNQINKTFIMQLGEGTEFVLSFNV